MLAVKINLIGISFTMVNRTIEIRVSFLNYLKVQFAKVLFFFQTPKGLNFLLD